MSAEMELQKEFHRIVRGYTNALIFLPTERRKGLFSEMSVGPKETEQSSSKRYTVYIFGSEANVLLAIYI